MSELSKILTLYVASLKVTLRSIALLLLALLVSIVLVLVSLPQELFSSNDIPKISLAIVYGEDNEDDAFVRDMNMGLSGINVVEEIRLLNAQEADTQLANGEVDAIIAFPENIINVLVTGGHATVAVKADDPIIGAAVYAVTDKVVETLDELQNYALIFDKAAREQITDSSARAEAINSFNINLIGQAFARMNNVEVPNTVSPFFSQALTLLLFFMVSIGSFFVAVHAARQYATNYIKHLYCRGIGFLHLLASQLLLSASIALIFGIVLGIVFSFLTVSVSIPALVISAILLSFVLTAMYLMFCGFRQQPKVATTRTLLGCLALMFIMLFAGGGFYPTGLMELDLRLLNPAWLSNQLALWSLGDVVNVLQLTIFIIPFLLACTVCYLEWRRAV